MDAPYDCEKAIRDLVSPGGFVDLFVDMARDGFAGAPAELLRRFFEGLFNPLGVVVRPLFVAVLENLDEMGAVDKVSEKLLDFVQKVREAEPCLGRSDEVWKEVAESVGVNADTLKHVVRQLSSKSEEEIRRKVEELAKSLKDAERQVRAISISPSFTYFYAKEWLAGKEEGGRLKLCGALLSDCRSGIYVEYVSNKLEAAVIEEVRKRAEEGGGIVVVKGAKGIGKSTATQVALYRILKHPIKVGECVYKPVVVDVEESDRESIEKFIKAAKWLGFLPIFYLNPTKPRAYPNVLTDLYQHKMPLEKLRRVFEGLRDIEAVAVIVLSDDQFQAVTEHLKDITPVDANQLLGSTKTEYVKALIEKYSGCDDRVIEKVAKDITSSFADGYAVAAVLAADWLRRSRCSAENMDKFVRKSGGDVHRFVLHYLWYGLFNGNEAVAKRYAPLLLAVGFFGPHPPKLARAVVEAFGGEPEDAMVRWFSRPLHGTLYEAMRKVTHGAVYRQFSVEDDDLCRRSSEEPCRLIEVCTKILAGLPRRNYSSLEDVAWEYVQQIAKALTTPPTERYIKALIDNFLKAFNVEEEVEGRWKIRYKAEAPYDVKVVETIVDELDILATLYGIAALPGWSHQLKPLEEWFFAGDKKVGVLGLYLFPLMRERSGELIKRAVAIAEEWERRGDYTDVDLWRAIGIVATSDWVTAHEEALEIAVNLITHISDRFVSVLLPVLYNFEPLLYEAWRKLKSRWWAAERLADQLALAAYNIAKYSSLGLLRFFAVGIDKLYPTPLVAERFDMLFKATSNAGKLLLLDVLVSTLNKDIGNINVAAMLLDTSLDILPTKVSERVEHFISSFVRDVARAYVAAHLYTRLVDGYINSPVIVSHKFDEVVKFTDKAVKFLNELKEAYAKDKATTEEILRPYLNLRLVKLDFSQEFNNLSWYVNHYAALVYMVIYKLEEALEHARLACELAKKLDSVYDEVLSCSLLQRIRAVKDGTLLIEEIEEIWQKALQSLFVHGVETVASKLGEYIIALAFVARFNDVEKVLKEWSCVLEESPTTAALTYGVLSLFDGRYLDKATSYLFELATTLDDAVKATQFVKKTVIEFAKNIIKSIDWRVENKSKIYLEQYVKIFLSALVGLAHCTKYGGQGLALAKAACWAGTLFEGTFGHLFGELFKALERATVGNCITDEVLKAVYKLYYTYV